MGLVREFAQQEKIVAAEAVGIMELLPFIHVGAGKGEVEKRALVGAVLPHRRLDPAEPEGFYGAELPAEACRFWETEEGEYFEAIIFYFGG